MIAFGILSAFGLAMIIGSKSRDAGILIAIVLSVAHAVVWTALGSLVALAGGLLGVWAYARHRKALVGRRPRWLLAAGIILGFAPATAVVAYVLYTLNDLLR